MNFEKFKAFFFSSFAFSSGSARREGLLEVLSAVHVHPRHRPAEPRQEGRPRLPPRRHRLVEPRPKLPPRRLDGVEVLTQKATNPLPPDVRDNCVLRRQLFRGSSLVSRSAHPSRSMRSVAFCPSPTWSGYGAESWEHFG